MSLLVYWLSCSMCNVQCFWNCFNLVDTCNIALILFLKCDVTKCRIPPPLSHNVSLRRPPPALNVWRNLWMAPKVWIQRIQFCQETSFSGYWFFNKPENLKTRDLQLKFSPGGLYSRLSGPEKCIDLSQAWTLVTMFKLPQDAEVDWLVIILISKPIVSGFENF